MTLKRDRTRSGPAPESRRRERRGLSTRLLGALHDFFRSAPAHGDRISAKLVASTKEYPRSSCRRSPWGPRTQSSRGNSVFVDEPAQDRAHPDVGSSPIRHLRDISLAEGRTKPDRPVGPVGVVVIDVLAQHALEMSSTPDERPVQAFRAHRGDPSARRRRWRWAPGWGL